jgi:hypothetical protein
MKLKTAVLFLAISILLSGCFYPNERRVEHQTPHPEQIEMIQRSIETYREKTGVLPIHTKEADTPIFEKYVVDFSKLIQQGYIDRAPSHSFEEGGVFQYVLVDVESDAKVKLIDLRLSNEVRSLQMRLNDYLSRNTYLPVDQVIEGGYFTLDYNKLNLKSEPLVQSPFSRQYLPFVADQNGRIGIDYRLDLYQEIQNRENLDDLEGKDIRFLLVENTNFVPVHSFAYTLKDGEPVFIR